MLNITAGSSSRMRDRARRTVTACVAVGALGLALVGCGGSDSLTGTSPGTTTDDAIVTATIGTDTTGTTSTDEVRTATTATDDIPGIDTPPRTYADTMDRIASAEEVSLDEPRFVANDSDVFCVIADAPGLTACETFESRHPAPPGACAHPGMPADVGRLEMEGSQVTPTCNSDTIRMPGARRVASGTVVRSADGSRQCIVVPEGVACVDVSLRRGFLLGNAEYTTLR